MINKHIIWPYTGEVGLKHEAPTIIVNEAVLLCECNCRYLSGDMIYFELAC